MNTRLLAKHVKNNKGKVGISALLIISVLVFTGTIFMVRHNTANAAAVTLVSDTLSNSAPSTVSNHTVDFQTPTGVDASSDTITITFPTGFATGSVAFGDMDLEIDDACDGTYETSKTLAGAPGASPTWGAAVSGSVITLTAPTDASSGEIAADACVRVEVGTNADSGTNQMTNPSKSAATGTADILTISIGGAFGDSGDMLIAIIEGVTVSVTIDESLSFNIAAETNANCDTIFGTEAGPDSTTTTIPFGTITSANTFNHACQNLTISTNASSGYAVTVETDTSLKSGGSVLISSGNCDGSCDESTSNTWSTNTNNGFAYSCDGADCSISAITDFRTFACKGATTTDCLPGGGESAQNIMTNAGSANNSTTSIEYRITLSGTQEAGTYTNTVTYIATPTF